MHVAGACRTHARGFSAVSDMVTFDWQHRSTQGLTVPHDSRTPDRTARSRTSSAAIVVIALAIILLAVLSGQDHRELAIHLLRNLVTHRF